jgi:hypothetical protein
MKSIYKFTLLIADQQTLTLPKGSRILSVTEQRGNIVLYSLVDTNAESTEDVLIIIHGTGHPANDIDDCTFLGTVKLRGGGLMFHVFMRAKI